jgi:hypothetical protein
VGSPLDKVEEIPGRTVFECEDDRWEEGLAETTFWLSGILLRTSDPVTLLVILETEPAYDKTGSVLRLSSWIVLFSSSSQSL